MMGVSQGASLPKYPPSPSLRRCIGVAELAYPGPDEAGRDASLSAQGAEAGYPEGERRGAAHAASAGIAPAFRPRLDINQRVLPWTPAPADHRAPGFRQSQRLFEPKF